MEEVTSNANLLRETECVQDVNSGVNVSVGVDVAPVYNEKKIEG